MLLSSARRATVFGIVALLVGVGGAAAAHEERAVGNITMRVGWLNEPTYAGSVNAVQVFLAKEGGGPIADGKLTAVVLFGNKDSTTKSQTITLNASDETPGEYTGAIIPSRPGTYTFHITGDAGGQKLDQFFTSSETTFDNVGDPTADEFPAKDPTAGQLAERLNNADSKTSSAKTLALAALIVGAAGILIAAVSLLRKRG
jgi:hypothetical protein